ncbi:MAG: peptide chain release factor N(5)-glutamine methyltransferase, partial [Oligoflexia bacterium]|nr:peptide chain release factor N(5)-glutamine methyltransferase [Oligoflexia bacterium]
PPYLVRDDGIEAEVLAHEPAPALFAPPEDPLHFYRRIALQGPGHLRAGGRVYCELPHERAGEILKLFENSGWNARILRDLAGRERVLAGSFGKALGQNG